VLPTSLTRTQLALVMLSVSTSRFGLSDADALKKHFFDVSSHLEVRSVLID